MSKHAERSKRSYHNTVDFSDFHRKAQMKKAKKLERKTLGAMIKDMFSRK